MRKFASFGFSTEGTIISASAAPHCGNILKIVVVVVDTASNGHPVTIHLWVNLGTAVYLKGIGLLKTIIVQELCESRGGRPGLSVLTSLLVSVDVKIY